MSRPILPWHFATELLPPDVTTVWMRRLPFYDKPVLAEFDAANEVFVVVVDVAGSESDFTMSIPVHAVHSWKYQYLADVPEGEDP